MLFQLSPGYYYIGDPYIFLSPEILDGYFNGTVTPGFYSYKSQPFFIDCTGFDEGSFLDIDQVEYIIYNGLLGVFPCGLCREACDTLGRLGRVMYYAVPFTVESNGDGYFKFSCYDYEMVLDTQMTGFSSGSDSGRSV